MDFYTKQYVHDRFIFNNIKKSRITKCKRGNHSLYPINYNKLYIFQIIKLRLVFNSDNEYLSMGFLELYGIINNYKLRFNWYIFIKSDENNQTHFQQKLHELKHKLSSENGRRKCTNYEYYWIYHNLKVTMEKIDK